MLIVAWWHLYLAALATHPLPVKALTSAGLAATSDGIAQRLLGAKKLAWRRCMLMAMFGLLWYGPSNHFWQGLLVSLFPPAAAAAAAAAPGAWRFLGGALRLLQRVGLDQLLYAPLNNCLMILYVSLVADQRSWPAARAKLVAELPAVQRRGWRVWPAVQLINQSLVPLELRVLCNNLVAVCWTVYVIARARSVRSSRKLPVFNLAALSPRFRPAGGGGGGHVRQE